MLELLAEASLIIGLLLIIILSIYGRRRRNNFLLAACFFTIWYALLITHLNLNGSIADIPHLVRTGNITGYLIFPFLYLYTRNIFYPGRFFNKKDLLFLVPACIYCIDMLPFFLQSAEYKLTTLQYNLAHQDQMLKVAEGWIALPWFHSIFRYVWALAIVILQVRLIRRNWDFEPSEKSNSKNKPVFRFIITLTFLLLPLIIPGIFGIALHMRWYDQQFILVNLSICLLISAIYIFTNPQILYGFSTVLPEHSYQPELQEVVETVDEEINPSNASRQGLRKLKTSETAVVSTDKTETSEAFKEEMGQRIEKLMLEQKPFLDASYTIHDLGKDIKIPVYQLSPYINQQLGTNFNSFINKYRIDYFITLSCDEKVQKMTLDGIAKEAGFSNRNTFINAFKKEKGSTPGQYLRALQEENT